MEKKYISNKEYKQFINIIAYSYGDNFNVDRIIDIFEYLKDKKHSLGDDNEVFIIENAHLDLLKFMLDRMFFFPKYEQAIESFLKSDYLSNVLKRVIYSILKNNCCSERLAELLNSEKKTHEFEKEQIKEIKESIYKAYDVSSDESERQMCSDISVIFNDYFFILDGRGPNDYIKEKYWSQLPIEMLRRSGLQSQASHYSGLGVDTQYLSEEHLFSLYKKFQKYYPDKALEFVKMVSQISKLTATEFINNYMQFVNNGFDSNFCNKEGNISIEDVYGSTRDLIGIASIVSLFNSEQSDWEKSFELNTHYSIKNKFIEMVEQYKYSQESENLKVGKTNTAIVLSRRREQN